MVEMAEDLLYRARIYQRTIDHRVPVEGAHRGVDLLLRRGKAVTGLDDVDLDELESAVGEARESFSGTS